MFPGDYLWVCLCFQVTVCLRLLFPGPPWPARIVFVFGSGSRGLFRVREGLFICRWTTHPVFLLIESVC
jgi:hypothetical protein